LEGAFALVVWENKTTPILEGNMMGVPKIYADIEDLHIMGDTYRV
jgi:acetoacetate decarboxylase